MGWGMSFAPVRTSFRHLARTFLSKPILLSLAAMVVYVGMSIALLAKLRIWQAENLKTTLIWAATFALAEMLQLGRVTEDDTYFRRTMREIVNVTVVVTFITETFTFSLPVEMPLVLAFAFLGSAHAMSGTKKEWEQVEALLRWLLSFMGLGLIVYALYKIMQEWNTFATPATARDFFIPILLSILYLPFIYFLSIYATYDRVFRKLSFRIKDERLLDYAKALSILNFRFDLEFLRRWARNVMLKNVRDRQEVAASIQHVNSLKQRERNPPSIPASQGWSPYAAMTFLHKEGLKPGDYHDLYGEWRAATPYLNISDNIISDHIVYYVEGGELAATQLNLVLDVNNPQNAADADERFCKVAATLLKMATEAKLNEEFFLREQGKLTDGDKTISNMRDNWQGGIAGGYSRCLKIEHGGVLHKERELACGEEET